MDFERGNAFQNAFNHIFPEIKYLKEYVLRPTTGNTLIFSFGLNVQGKTTMIKSAFTYHYISIFVNM